MIHPISWCRTIFWLTSLVLILSNNSLSQGKDQFFVNEFNRHTISRSIHGDVSRGYDLGRTRPEQVLEHMSLALKRRESAEGDFNNYFATLRSSRAIPAKLSPEAFGERFGITDADLDLLKKWLVGHGFQITEIGKARGWIRFTGTVAQAEEAFGTEIHDITVDGKREFSNINEVSIPSELAHLTYGPVGLNSFRFKSHLRNHSLQQQPTYNYGFGHYLSPGDLSVIYNIGPVHNSYTGAGISIAVIGQSDINLADISAFQSTFGLPINTPTIIHPTSDPGFTSSELEGDLDLETINGVAPGAALTFVTSYSALDAAEWAAENGSFSIISVSFEECENTMTSAERSSLANAWAIALGNGRLPIVASGDEGASTCSDRFGVSGSGLSINGLAATADNIAVGGTSVFSGGNSSTYWSSSNSSNGTSALSYIPEVTWNDAVSGALFASGGGASIYNSKPVYQNAPGVPSDGKRDIPDVAFLAGGGGNPYAVYSQGSLVGVEGTSCSTPLFAGMVALLQQKIFPALGESNQMFNFSKHLYDLGNAQYSGTGPIVFHDITSGNNSIPGVTGYNATTGYDLTTGLGSIDLNAFITAYPVPPPATQCNPPQKIIDMCSRRSGYYFDYGVCACIPE